MGESLVEGGDFLFGGEAKVAGIERGFERGFERVDRIC